MIFYLKRKIIFLHIPKTGGKTLFSIFRRNLGSKYLLEIPFSNTHEYPTLKNLSEKDKNRIKLIHGHMAFGIHSKFSCSYQYATMMREPAQRLFSHYCFAKRSKNNELYHTINSNHWTFEDFIANSDKLGIRNVQSRLISGMIDGERDIAKKAIANIEDHFKWVGVQELFDESLIVFRHAFNLDLPYYRRWNVGKNKSENPTISSQTLERIKEYNEQDYILYNYCIQLFNKEKAKVPFFKAQLKFLKGFNRLYISKPVRKLRKALNPNFDKID